MARNEAQRRRRPRRAALAALGGGLAAACAAGATPTAPLIFSVTYRDFLPARCMRRGESPVYSLDVDADRAWGLAPNALTTNVTYGCPHVQDILNGTVSGHPDFETRQSILGVSGYSWEDSPHIYSQSSGVTTIIDRSGFDYASSGLSKPRYCSATERCGTNAGMWSTASAEYFKWWFNDNPRFNRRVGRQLVVPAKFDEPGTYQYDSGSFFGPLDTATPEVDGVWPWTALEKQLEHKFSFTTELHTWFEYQGDEEFTFTGDDDLWVFINGHLAVDLGGVHGKAATTVRLKDYESRLELTVGDVFEFDLFHAERHTIESNFLLTTTLRTSCNVLHAGVETLVRRRPVGDEVLPPRAAELGTRLQSNVNQAIAGADNHQIVLLRGTESIFTGHAFFMTQQNVGAGFQFDFQFSVDGTGAHGLAFVLHRRPEGLDNWPFSMGGKLGLAYVSHSVAVVLDFTHGELRLHYNARVGPEGYNDATQNAATVQVRDSVYRNLQDGKLHKVSVRYLERPDWFEVYLDGSLYLRKRFFNIVSVIGGRDAYVGFTSSVMDTNARVVVSDVSMRTVEVSPSGSVFVQGNKSSIVAHADGKEAVDVKIQTFDTCGNLVENGGVAEFVGGFFVPVPPAASNMTDDIDAEDGYGEGLRGTRSQSTEANKKFDRPIPALVVDNKDGTYSLVLKTSISGEYELYAWFGNNCTAASGEDGVYALAETSAADCWFAKAPQRVAMEERYSRDGTSTPLSPIDKGPNGTTIKAIYLGAGAGVATLLMAFVAFYWRDKNRWQKDKRFIGMAQGPTPVSDEQYQHCNTRHDLMVTSRTLQRERAKVNRASRDEEIENLKADQAALRAEMARLKQNSALNHMDQQLGVFVPGFPEPGSAEKRRREFRPDV